MRNADGTIEAISLLPGEACELVAGIEAALSGGEPIVFLERFWLAKPLWAGGAQ